MFKMTYEDYLQHFGIQGMRWGRRNGPPYPLSRRNMTAAERQANPKSSDPVDRPSDKKSKSIKVDTPTGEKTVPEAKPAKEMSDKELNAALDRMKKEKELRTLETNDVTKGKRWVQALLLTAGGVAAGTYAAGLGKKVGTAGLTGTDKLIEKAKDLINVIRYKRRVNKEGVL